MNRKDVQMQSPVLLYGNCDQGSFTWFKNLPGWSAALLDDTTATKLFLHLRKQHRDGIRTDIRKAPKSNE